MEKWIRYIKWCDQNNVWEIADVNLKRDTVLCPVPYGGALFFNNVIPHRRWDMSNRQHNSFVQNSWFQAWQKCHTTIRIVHIKLESLSIPHVQHVLFGPGEIYQKVVPTWRSVHIHSLWLPRVGTSVHCFVFYSGPVFPNSYKSQVHDIMVCGF